MVSLNIVIRWNIKNINRNQSLYFIRSRKDMKEETDHSTRANGW